MSYLALNDAYWDFFTKRYLCTKKGLHILPWRIVSIQSLHPRYKPASGLLIISSAERVDAYINSKIRHNEPCVDWVAKPDVDHKTLHPPFYAVSGLHSVTWLWYFCGQSYGHSQKTITMISDLWCGPDYGLNALGNIPGLREIAETKRNRIKPGSSDTDWRLALPLGQLGSHSTRFIAGEIHESGYQRNSGCRSFPFP